MVKRRFRRPWEEGDVVMVELLIGVTAGSRTDDDLIAEIDHSSTRADPVDVREAIEIGANALPAPA